MPTTGASDTVTLTDNKISAGRSAGSNGCSYGTRPIGMAKHPSGVQDALPKYRWTLGGRISRNSRAQIPE